MLVGPASDAVPDAAVTDQSDGWALIRLHGAVAHSVLARLVPVDMRGSVFKHGHTARTLLYHMPVSITRTAANSFDIMVFRSMSKTAVDEFSHAMKSVAAQEN